MSRSQIQVKRSDTDGLVHIYVALVGTDPDLRLDIGWLDALTLADDLFVTALQAAKQVNANVEDVRTVLRSLTYARLEEWNQ